MNIKVFASWVILGTAVLCLTAVVANAQISGTNCLAQATTEAKISCLTNLITQLTSQVVAFQSSQSNSQTQWCHTFNSNMGYAQSGSAEVGYLHTALQKQGISFAPDTGNTYSEGTSQSIMKFQKNYGISQTGYTGPLTRAKLNSLYACNQSHNQTTVQASASQTGCSIPTVNCGSTGGSNVTADATTSSTDQCYAHYTCNGISYESAKSACTSAGGNLVTITSQAEQDKVLSLNKYGWIGLDDKATEGTFQWVTGEPLSFTVWAWPPAPDDSKWHSLQGEDCVENYFNGGYSNYSAVGLWNDFPCDNPEFGDGLRVPGFICEFEREESPSSCIPGQRCA